MPLNFKDESQVKRFLNQLDEVTPGILGIFNLELGTCTYIGGNIGATLGYTPEEVYAMGANVVQTLLHPEDTSRFELHLEQMQNLKEGKLQNSNIECGIGLGSGIGF